MTKGQLSTLFLIALLLSVVLAKDSFLVLKGTSKFAQTSIFQDDVADLISHVSGLTSVHNDVDRSAFPKVDILNLPKANVLIALESVSEDMLHEKMNNKQFLDTTDSIEIVKTPFPDDSIALLTSLVTGEDHTVHGIVGHSWKASQYSTVQAFTANGQSQVPNLADRISHESQGAARTFVVGGNKKIASAMGVHLELLNKNPTWNSQIMHYSKKHGIIDSVTEDVIVGFKEIKKAAQKRSMKLETKEGYLLASELYAIENLHKLIGASGTSDLDFIAVGVTSIKALTLHYGADSVQVKSALEFLDVALSQMEANLNEMYDSRVVMQVVGLGSSLEEHTTKTQGAQVRKFSVTAAADTTGYSADQVSAFQTQFWVALVLIITTIVAFLVLVKMDMLYDSLLYKTTDGPRPIQNVK